MSDAGVWQNRPSRAGTRFMVMTQLNGLGAVERMFGGVGNNMFGGGGGTDTVNDSTDNYHIRLTTAAN